MRAGTTVLPTAFAAALVLAACTPAPGGAGDGGPDVASDGGEPGGDAGPGGGDGGSGGQASIVQLQANERCAVYLSSAGDVYTAYMDFQYGPALVVTKVPGPSGIRKIAAATFNHIAGLDEGMALDQNGQIHLWDVDIVSGRSGEAHLFSGMSAFGTAKIVDIAAGGYVVPYYLAVDDAGRVWGWGDNSDYQLGDGTKTHRNEPKVIEGLPATVVRVSAGARHAMALTAEGNVHQWGTLSQGEVYTTPQLASAAGPAERIEAGSAYSIARKKDGSLYVWGHLAAGTVSGVVNPVAIAAGAETYFPPMFVAGDGTLYSVAVTGSPAPELVTDLVPYRFALVDLSNRAFYVTQDGKLLGQPSWQTAPIVKDNPLP